MEFISTVFFTSLLLTLNHICLYFFFFFQAEDGIRDLTVTGVQTCALPIYPAGVRDRAGRSDPELPGGRPARRAAHRGDRAGAAQPCLSRCTSGRTTRAFSGSGGWWTGCAASATSRWTWARRRWTRRTTFRTSASRWPTR